MEEHCEKNTCYMFNPKIVREGDQTLTSVNGISFGTTYGVYGNILCEID